MDLALSLVIPAYNEERRLPPFLDLVHGYMDNEFDEDYEVIIVDDGSRDGTRDALRSWAGGWDRLSVLTHPRNLGKGAAVRTGVLSSRGRLILFCDADGATPIQEERKLRAAIDGGSDLAVGSRLLRAPGTPCARRWHREIPGRVFARLVRATLGLHVRDSQCGFKMFRREAGLRLFAACREEGYLFDLHVLALAERLGYRLSEVAIRWADVPGSKVHLVGDSWRMFVGLRRVLRSVEGHEAGSRGRAPECSPPPRELGRRFV